MRFKNPANNYVEEVAGAWMWTLIFGVFYFAYKGVWRHAAIGMVAALFTGGISWFVYPFFAKEIMRKHYLQLGWVQIED